MKLILTIQTDNAAFEDCAGEEVARILHKAADKVEDWPGASPFAIGLFDINGNRVGAFDAEE